jgi:hypothetical protein
MAAVYFIKRKTVQIVQAVQKVQIVGSVRDLLQDGISRMRLEIETSAVILVAYV